MLKREIRPLLKLQANRAGFHGGEAKANYDASNNK